MPDESTNALCIMTFPTCERSIIGIEETNAATIVLLRILEREAQAAQTIPTQALTAATATGSPLAAMPVPQRPSRETDAGQSSEPYPQSSFELASVDAAPTIPASTASFAAQIAAPALTGDQALAAEPLIVTNGAALGTIAHPLSPARLGYRNYPSLRQEFNGIGPALPFHTFTFHEHIAPTVDDSAAAAETATGFAVAAATDHSGSPISSTQTDPAAAAAAGCPALLFGSWLRVETGHALQFSELQRGGSQNSSSRDADTNTRRTAAGGNSDSNSCSGFGSMNAANVGDGSRSDSSDIGQLLLLSSGSLQLQSGQWRRGRFRATRTRRWMGALRVECQWEEPAAGTDGLAWAAASSTAAKPTAAGASARFHAEITADVGIGQATSAAVRVWMAPSTAARRFRRDSAASRSAAASATSGAASRPSHSSTDPPPDLLFTFLPLRGVDGAQSLAALVEQVSSPNAAVAGQSASVGHGRAFIRI